MSKLLQRREQKLVVEELQQQTFSFCVIFEDENMVGTASARRVTFFPDLSMYCSSK